MRESVTGQTWDRSILPGGVDEGPAFFLAERQYHLCAEAIDSPGLKVFLHSSAGLAALETRGCILGKEFVALVVWHRAPQSCPLFEVFLLPSPPACSAVGTQPWRGVALGLWAACLSLCWSYFSDKAYFRQPNGQSFIALCGKFLSSLGWVLGFFFSVDWVAEIQVQPVIWDAPESINTLYYNIVHACLCICMWPDPSISL